MAVAVPIGIAQSAEADRAGEDDRRTAERSGPTRENRGTAVKPDGTVASNVPKPADSHDDFDDNDDNDDYNDYDDNDNDIDR